MPDNDTQGEVDDRRHLGDSSHYDDSLGYFLRSGSHIPRRQGGSERLRRGLARSSQRISLLRNRPPVVLLHIANDTHLDVLRADLDKGVQEAHPRRHQGRPDGKDAAEEQGQSGQDAGSCRHPVRGVLAAAVHHLRPGQDGRRTVAQRRRTDTHGGPDRSVARIVQLVHQPDTVRFFQ